MKDVDVRGGGSGSLVAAAGAIALGCGGLASDETRVTQGVPGAAASTSLTSLPDASCSEWDHLVEGEPSSTAPANLVRVGARLAFEWFDPLATGAHVQLSSRE